MLFVGYRNIPPIEGKTVLTHDEFFNTECVNNIIIDARLCNEKDIYLLIGLVDFNSVDVFIDDKFEDIVISYCIGIHVEYGYFNKSKNIYSVLLKDRLYNAKLKSLFLE